MPDIPDIPDVSNMVSGSNMTSNASFEEIDVTPPTSKLTKITNANRVGEVEQIMSQAINLNESNIFHEPTCLICSSPNRNELEKKFLEKSSYKDVALMYKSKHGLDIGESVIENHVVHHSTKAAVKHSQMREYVQRIRSLNSQNVTTMEKIATAHAFIIERIMGINSLVPNADESPAKIEQIKSAETAKLVTSLGNLLKLQASILGEMKNNGEMVYIQTDEFVGAFRDALKSAKTDREREIITTLLDRLETIARRAK